MRTPMGPPLRTPKMIIMAIQLILYQVLRSTARRDARRVAVESRQRRTRLARPARPAYRLDGQARRCASRPVRPRRPVARYGARCGPCRAQRCPSPSTERHGSAFAPREPSLRCVPTANDACRAATNPRRRAAPPCRTEIRPILGICAAFSPRRFGTALCRDCGKSPRY
jgi:hypothetical protein